MTMVLREFNPRANLPLKANSLWKIDRGAVRTLSWLEDGTIVTLGIWGIGDVVGLTLTPSQPYQIECLTKVQATAIPLIENNQLIEVLKAHVQQLEDLTLIRSHKRTEFMLLHLLSWLAEKFGRETNTNELKTGQLIDLRLTHQDIADILGSSRVTITRMLTHFEQQGLINRLPVHRILLYEEGIWDYEI